MAILKVARMGHPVLRKVARKLTAKEIESDKIQSLIENMIQTMHEYGGIGLAAPQVHESIQLAIIELDEQNDRYEGAKGQALEVYINPKITVIDTAEQAFWEGCLSVPELRGLVHRPRKIQVDYLNRKGKAKKIVAEGFLATVFQHELDHLSGMLFIQRMKEMSKLSFIDEYQRYWAKDEEDDSEGSLED